MDSSTDMNIINPLFIDLVVHKVLKFVPLKDIKNCRMVCQRWNYLAKPFLGKRGKIIFKKSRSPSVFTDYFSQTDRQNFQPFDTFVFDCIGVTLFDLHTFFMKIGKYIKKLEFKSIAIWLNETDSNPIGKLNLDPLLELTMNLEDLAITHWSNPFELTLHKLSSIRNLCLNRCSVIFKSGEKRITPLKIHLKHLNQNITINDFVDFSKCTDIYIKNVDSSGYGEPGHGVVVSFDFSRDFANCNKIRLDFVTALNWKTSKMTTECLHLHYHDEMQTSHVHIPTKELKIKSDFNSLSHLTEISKYVQKLTLVKTNYLYRYESRDVELLDLPNLKNLKITSATTAYFWEINTCDIYKMVRQFANCNKLIDLELMRYDCHFTKSELDVSWIPKSVRKLNLAHLASNVLFVGTEEPTHLDVLILYGFTSSSIYVKNVTKRIKSKVLIRKVELCEKSQAFELRETVADFVSFILEEKETKNIFVEFIGVESLCASDKILINKIVDKESSHYEFVGQRGKAISQEEFNTILKSNSLGSFESYSSAKARNYH